MIDTVFLGPSLGGGQNFLITVGGFYNEREYSKGDWPVLFISIKLDGEAPLMKDPPSTCSIPL